MEIKIPDEKKGIIDQATSAYNSAHDAALSSEEYLLMIIRDHVAEELALVEDQKIQKFRAEQEEILKLRYQVMVDIKDTAKQGW